AACGVAVRRGRRRSGRSFGVVVDGDQLDELELACAAGRRDLHRIAGLLVDQGAPDGRRRRDEALGGVGVLRHHELKHELFAVALDHVQRRSEAGFVLGNAIDVHQRDLGRAFLQHADARLDEPLPLFRRVIFGVLAQIAQLARALDFLRQLELQLAIQRLDLVLELLDQSIFHRCRHEPGHRTTVLSFSRMTITSRQNPLVARFRDAARGDAGDVLLLDGAHLVADALAAQLRIDLAAVTPASRERTDVQQIASALADAGVSVATVAQPVMDAVSPVRSSSGIVALAARPSFPIDRLFAGAAPLVVIAVDVQDPGNVGAIVRVAEAAGATGVVAAGASANPFGWKALRGSMGSALRLPTVAAADAAAAIA